MASNTHKYVRKYIKNDFCGIRAIWKSKHNVNYDFIKNFPFPIHAFIAAIFQFSNALWKNFGNLGLQPDLSNLLNITRLIISHGHYISDNYRYVWVNICSYFSKGSQNLVIRKRDSLLPFTTKTQFFFN